MSMSVEVVVMWIGVTGYAMASTLFIIGLIFSRAQLVSLGLAVTIAGTAAHVVAVAGRWIRVGHGPYLGFYEVVSSYALITALAIIFLVWRYRSLAIIGAVALPIAFLLLGAAMFTPRAELAITASLASWWLGIHVTFAKLAYGSFVVAFVLGLVMVLRHKARGTWSEMLAKLPAEEQLDDLCFKFVALGFIFLGIMIGAGAIWANEAWGRYWAWDPIETWSLIAWLVYAAALHARLTLGWRGKRFAWVAMAALPVILFSLIGVPLVYQSIHGAYLLGY